ncbi:Protein-associating with the carboxyl-terminal domain of ezrin [Geodia barretti]|nr:Protein-associating with the carboxyl-terminal domain of ezrin [Geodia barretti]
MTETVARRCLWKHLLTPASSQHPRRMTFDPCRICPLFDEDLFTYHAVPLLLNLMESHDYHVRMVLLEHLVQFTPLCPREELVGSLLPEVLVGLHDVSDEMVQATLRALADLVSLVGGETIVGTTRSCIFADSTPRSQKVVMEKTQTPPPSGSPNSLPSPLTSLQTLPLSPLQAPPIFSSKAPPTSQDEARRQQRAEKMREKREMQRRKKMAAKLGLASRVADVDGVESDELTAPTGHAQYSPSVSHDEEDRVNSETVGGEEGEMEGEWDEFTEEGGGDVEWGDEGGWGGGKVETWTITADSSRLHREAEDEREPSEVSGEVGEEPVQEKRRQSGGTALKLGRKQTGKEEKREKGEGSSGSKVTLSEADRLRLEEQAAWSTEPDFFADMAPSVAKKTGVSASLGGVESPTLTTKQSSSLQYQPAEEEKEGGGWSAGWNDF